VIPDLIELFVDVGVRWLGVAVLKAVTLGSYRGGRSQDLVFEGTVGLLTVVAILYLAYRWWPR
jgi:hypothetical protein